MLEEYYKGYLQGLVYLRDDLNSRIEFYEKILEKFSDEQKEDEV